MNKNAWPADHVERVRADALIPYARNSRTHSDEQIAQIMASIPKPVEMISRAIKSSSEQGSIVVEPFSGSGTTIIACENLNRKCRAIEISPAYVAIALQRWADHTGKTPVLIE